ncbi:precorrin 6A synthase [Nocardioides dokdonensis FR1436]|uniref:Precorrin 6A synthase n=1 Tax=Nocardioides dokdonensis FR1436 TaxID=1300347 RepID=A0A1A9GPM4_9ACTN|nr:precorrin-6A synthase (deacetylating) [Nocardioides dokdonensis]ANH40254.1 precorrin 6A synthase [Nocardioides dokdonensis FR1436]
MAEAVAEAMGGARRVVVVGIGMGPQHVTVEAAVAIGSVDVVLAFAKGPDDPLLEVRRAVCTTYGVPLVVLEDPPRARHDDVDYDAAVDAWHAARAEAWEAALAGHPGDLGLLVWGDPGLYDSTLRLLDRLQERRPLAVEVVPGISSLSLLAARHRLVLHDVGAPLHVTTARRLPEALAEGQRNVVVVLNRRLDALADPALADWSIWWGANLGAPGEQLVAGRVGDVLADLEVAREAARTVDGWVLDLHLLRAPAPDAA